MGEGIVSVTLFLRVFETLGQVGVERFVFHVRPVTASEELQLQGDPRGYRGIGQGSLGFGKIAVDSREELRGVGSALG